MDKEYKETLMSYYLIKHKYQLGEHVFLIRDDMVHMMRVACIKTNEIGLPSPSIQYSIYKEGMYLTNVEECDLFTSKQDLLNSL